MLYLCRPEGKLSVNYFFKNLFIPMVVVALRNLSLPQRGREFLVQRQQLAHLIILLSVLICVWSVQFTNNCLCSGFLKGVPWFLTSFSGMYPLLTCQLTWQFPIFDGPSNLGQDIIVAVVGRWASRCTIPSYTDWPRAMGGALSPYPTGQPRTVLTPF
jgi:hypothetical protein